MSDKSSNLADRLEAFIPRGDGYNSDYANTLTEAVEALRGAHAIPEGYALVPVDQLKKIHRDLDACGAGACKSGCGAKLSPGQYWSFCGETDMGQSMPALCKSCGGDYLPERP